MCYIGQNMVKLMMWVWEHFQFISQYLHVHVYCLYTVITQYKHLKNLADIRHHSDVFGLDCECNFFVTSHSKNTCDWIGGTAKWLTAQASLQSPLEGQIVSVRHLFDWCVGNIQHITFFFITAANIDSQRALLDDWFASVFPARHTCCCFHVWWTLVVRMHKWNYKVKFM